MRKDYFAIALLLSLASARAGADVLSVPEGDPTPQIVLPTKGLSMAEVQKNYGEPRARRPTVGGDSPKHPPITRWDYDAFSVIFERDKVVDAVVPGAPPKVFNREELKPTVVVLPPDAPLPAEAAPAPAAPAPAEAAVAAPVADAVQAEPDTAAPAAPPADTPVEPATAPTPPPAASPPPSAPAAAPRDPHTTLPTPK